MKEKRKYSYIWSKIDIVILKIDFKIKTCAGESAPIEKKRSF